MVMRKRQRIHAEDHWKAYLAHTKLSSKPAYLFPKLFLQPMASPPPLLLVGDSLNKNLSFFSPKGATSYMRPVMW